MWCQECKLTKLLIFVAHLVLLVHLGPTGEQKWYNISMTTATGTHEGSSTILRNTMRQNSTITVMNMKRQLEGVYLPWSMNYMRSSITLIWTLCIQIHTVLFSSFQKSHTIYYKLCGCLHTIMFYDIILSWLTCGQSQKMKRDVLMKPVGKVVGLTGDSMIWHFCGIPF